MAAPIRLAWSLLGRVSRMPASPRRRVTSLLVALSLPRPDPGSGVKGDGSGVRGDDSGVRGDGSGVRGNDSGVRGDGSGVRGDESGVRGDGSGVRGDGSGVRGDDSGVRSDDSGVKGDGSGVRGDGSGVRGDGPREVRGHGPWSRGHGDGLPRELRWLMGRKAVGGGGEERSGEERSGEERSGEEQSGEEDWGVPMFGLRGEAVEVLETPRDFYRALHEGIGTAKRRIVMASLYLGTGDMESQLVEALRQALRRSLASRDPRLHIHVLLDATRGSRGSPNSVSMLLPLLEEASVPPVSPSPRVSPSPACLPPPVSPRPGVSVRVSLYHTPALRGLVRLLLPEKLNETVGLQHMKLYVSDDTVIVSGANLSESYFTARQDRYVRLHSAALCDFFCDLVACVGDSSLQLAATATPAETRGDADTAETRGDADTAETRARGDAVGGFARRGADVVRLLKPPPVGPHPYLGDEMEFVASARSRILGVVKMHRDRARAVSPSEDVDTWIYPLIQMGQLGVDIDEKWTLRLLSTRPHGSRVTLATGYLNVPDSLSARLLGCPGGVSVLTASPEANGFYGAGGMLGAVPHAYSLIARRFFKRLHSSVADAAMFEYKRPGWTFHAKGLWVTLPGHQSPSLTLVGSTNFGHRSVERDLEAQLCITTTSPSLRQQLHQEERCLLGWCSAVSAESLSAQTRGLRLWVRLLSPLLRHFF